MSVQSLPSGTVSFLFTDIEASTALWDAYPELMKSALARHDELVCAAIEAHGGYVFATGGDGFAAAFATAAEAVSAGVDAQRALGLESWPEGLELGVRMGVHTGEVQERGGDYFGPPVNRAARLMGSAHGGQMVLSDLTAQLLGPTDELVLVDLGLVALRGVVEPVHVFGVSAEGLDWLDRPLVSTQRTAGNLPRPQTELVGDLSDLLQRVSGLPRVGLVTLTGSGGVGKTRAAVEIGWLVVDEFADGAWVVELGSVADPGAAVAAVGSVLSAQPQPGSTMVESVVDWCVGRRMLLILDNCEHVLEPVMELVSALVSTCPGVTVLATSREPLGVDGERVIRIPSLDSERSVELFCARAAAADSSFIASPDDVEAITEICARVDGIPLAIELAAARSRSLSPTEILSRLDDRFRLLRGGGRGGLERHQTLRAAVTWSYQLLSADEKLLFDRTSVFAGTFDLAAAEAICVGSGIDELDVVDLIGELVDKSMVIAERNDTSMRYRLLETLRQYAEERLDDRGETADLRGRHLSRYIDVANAARPLWLSPEQLTADAVYGREWDNLRAAHSWAHITGDLEACDSLIIATGSYALVAFRDEHREWIERTLALGDQVGSNTATTLATTLAMGAAWAMFGADIPRALELAGRGIDAEPEGAYVGACLAWMYYGLLADARPDEASQFVPCMRRALARDPHPQVEYMIRMVFGAMARSAESDEDHRQFGLLCERIGSPTSLARAALTRANRNMAREGRDANAAVDDYREAIRLAAPGAPTEVIWASAGLAVTLSLEQLGDARSAVRDALSRSYDIRLWLGVLVALGACAHHLLDTDPEGAATVLGYSSPRATALIGANVEVRERTLAAVAEMSKGQEWMANGAQMDRHQIVAYAFSRLAD